MHFKGTISNHVRNVSQDTIMSLHDSFPLKTHDSKVPKIFHHTKRCNDVFTRLLLLKKRKKKILERCINRPFNPKIRCTTLRCTITDALRFDETYTSTTRTSSLAVAEEEARTEMRHWREPPSRESSR